jgi:hypothetical protein
MRKGNISFILAGYCSLAFILTLGVALYAQTGPGSTVRKSPAASKPGPAAHARVMANYGKLPLAFERNDGQTDQSVQFLARGSGYTLFLTHEGAVFSLRQPDPLPTYGSPGGGLPRSPKTGEIPAQFARAASTANARRGSTGTLTMRLAGASPHAHVHGSDELPGKSNYFVGSDPSQWHTNVPTYAKVRYEGVYRGIDVVYYGNQRQLEYDFVVAPGADPRVIRLSFGVRQLAAAFSRRGLLRRYGNGNVAAQQASPGQSGSELPHSKALRAARRPDQSGCSPFATHYSLCLAANGDLLVRLDGGELRFHKPLVYQPARASSSESRVAVEGHYRLSSHQVSFGLGNYDHTRPLVIDPAFVYSTFLGGNNYDQANAITVDSSGNSYVTGFTCSANFPTTHGAFQTVFGGSCNGNYQGGDAFVTKLNAAGSAVIYSTYLGTSSVGNGIAGTPLGMYTSRATPIRRASRLHQARCKLRLAAAVSQETLSSRNSIRPVQH